MIDFNEYFKHEGHLANVENKKTFEICGFAAKNIYNTEISNELNEKEAKPYLDMYERERSKLLKEFYRHESSRRLVLNFDNDVCISQNPNCIICLQLIFRFGIIDAIIYARSSDIKKIESDLSTMKAISSDFCKQVKVEMGNFTFFAGSFHKYL